MNGLVFAVMAAVLIKAKKVFGRDFCARYCVVHSGAFVLLEEGLILWQRQGCVYVNAIPDPDPGHTSNKTDRPRNKYSNRHLHRHHQ